MNLQLLQEYQRQYDFRAWTTSFAHLNSIIQETLLKTSNKQIRILDLGCSLGQVSSALYHYLSDLYPHVEFKIIGIDMNPTLIAYAQEHYANDNLSFIQSDLIDIEQSLNHEELFDGIWCSFTAAYFPEIEVVLNIWKKLLTYEGWICLIDIDDLFGHQPLSNKYTTYLQSFYTDAFQSKRYDFCIGHKLPCVLNSCFQHVHTYLLPDSELSFSGPITNQRVVENWKMRLTRLPSLQSLMGQTLFEEFSKDFLHLLQQSNHESICKVYCCIGINKYIV